METLYTPKEQELVLEKFKINLDEFVKYFIVFEKVYELTLGTTEEGSFRQRINMIENIRRRDAYKVLNERFKANVSLYNSLLYYIRKEDKEFRSLKEKSNIDDISKYRDSVMKLLTTTDNYIRDLAEQSSKEMVNKPKILVFETTPDGIDDYHFRTEARTIMDIFSVSDSPLCPIVRFGTNVNIFKETCNDFGGEIIHFICHGSTSGDLKLLKEILTYDTFKKYFQTEYKIFHPDPIIELCYFNSCYSDSITSIIRIDKDINNIFRYLIGYIGKNDSSKACFFSECFYNKVCLEYTSKDIPTILKESKDYSESINSSWPTYLSNLIIR